MTFQNQCTDGERSVAIKLIDSFKDHLNNNDLFIFDRGYPSLDFFAYLIEKNVKFIIRTPIHFYKSSINPLVPDQIIELRRNGNVMRLRAIRFTLPSGEVELLITNIEEESFGIEDFKTLYFKRWGVIQTFRLLADTYYRKEPNFSDAPSTSSDQFSSMNAKIYTHSQHNHLLIMLVVGCLHSIYLT